MMQLYGRANMYTDYVKFCTEARRQRAEAKAEAKRLAMKRQDNIILSLYWAACLGIGAMALSIFIYILTEASQ